MNTRTKHNWRPLLETLEARQLLSVYADFNGDGRDDLAIGVPGEDSGAGMVQVLYGSATGLTATGSQTWTRTGLGHGLSEAGDNFGASLAGGDFNNDGFADLAIGAPGEDFGTATDAGVIHIIKGSVTGLTVAGNSQIHQNTSRVRDVAETGDLFGKSLAAGDWNSDGFIDLAVGVPGQDLPGKADAGAVHIFYGGGAGIKPPGNQTFNLDSPGMHGTARAGGIYGSTLTAGDYDGDGWDDLAVGTPLHTFLLDGTDQGGVGVIYGGANGLSPQFSAFLEFDLSSDEGAQCGYALATGGFDGDGRDDLAVGCPFHGAGTSTEAGKIVVFYGTITDFTNPHFYRQSDFGLTNDLFDNFGAALTAADFDNDGFDDVAIGIPNENFGTTVDSGAVLVAFGSAAKIATTGDVTLTQTTAGNNEETDDHFGEALAAGDFNGNGVADIAIGTPDENVLSVVDAGAVYVLYGGATFTGGQTWSQDIAGIADTSETGDSFGGGLDAGAGKSAPGGGSGRQDLAQLISADFELESLLTKPNKRRLPSGRR